MAETQETPPGGAGTPADHPRVAIQAQYVKDLSFENPRAPFSLQRDRQLPQLQLRRLEIKRQKLAADHHEVILDLRVEGCTGEDILFMVELSYVGLVVALNVPESSLEPSLLVECPRLLFPFARRIIADTIRDGGFPPLLLDPIDFVELYRRHQQQVGTEAESDREGQAVANPIVDDGEAD